MSTTNNKRFGIGTTLPDETSEVLEPALKRRGVRPHAPPALLRLCVKILRFQRSTQKNTESLSVLIPL